ncbi:hypothetical protein FNAPI_6744 [Fusarium napiforme]|uniref:Uncharacterized protein n=1 Tax=Fusarium napiforme TaxID=42672 RepID=A0A8H5JEA6_9HYPO|nr:hypothetical protein FNAPI_6744 [Fusarium napiforme]
MSQVSPGWPDAAVKIRRVATVDGPDKFWPELLPELNLVGGFCDNEGWDLHLQNSAGAEIMNAMAPADVCPGAMVYLGTSDGIKKASITAKFLANTGHMCITILKCCEIDLRHAKRTANLRLRVADTHEYAQPRNDSPPSPLELSDQLAVFLLPWRNEPEFAAGGFKVEKKALVLEEVNGGTNKWGWQLGHIKAAQMNGVGQHIFFGPLEPFYLRSDEGV